MDSVGGHDNGGQNKSSLLQSILSPASVRSVIMGEVTNLQPDPLEEPSIINSNQEEEAQSKLNSYISRQDLVELLEKRETNLIGTGFTFSWIDNHSDFLYLTEACQQAMDEGTQPERISQGTSGSYFIRSPDGRIVGVFKPKDEEPYGALNPKWIKWLHRTCCPCLFGRSFLMPNTGYVSEAAASLVDSFLGLDVVPRTQVTHLTSSQFGYPWWEHYKQWRTTEPQSAGYPLKLGSFQLFVQNFEESTVVMERLEMMRPWDSSLMEAFQAEFEKMTILDYVIRNTDRTMSNWLIHLSWKPLNRPSPPPSLKPLQSQQDVVDQVCIPLRPVIKIACIDNGLAFPHRHPTDLRSYPYSWALLPEARIPYSSALRARLLPLLRDVDEWEGLAGRLRQLFQIDTDFDESIFKRQMAVLRGQIYNLVQVLQTGGSPLDLVERPLVVIDRVDEGNHFRFSTISPLSDSSPGNTSAPAAASHENGARHKHRINHIEERALCRWC